MENVRISCHKCKYYYITWDKTYPYGCRFFKFKTQLLPSRHVFEISGKTCLSFQQKEK